MWKNVTLYPKCVKYKQKKAEGSTIECISCFVVMIIELFIYYECLCVSQPGPGTECCVCRSWASTTWRSCQLICLMTPCTSARHLMPPWGPGGPNSPSSVCVFAWAHVCGKFCETLCASHTLLSRSSPTRRPGDRWGSGGAAECGRVLQLELRVSRG